MRENPVPFANVSVISHFSLFLFLLARLFNLRLENMNKVFRGLTKGIFVFQKFGILASLLGDFNS